MQFIVSADLEYDIAAPAQMFVCVHARRDRSQTTLSEELEIRPRGKPIVDEIFTEDGKNHLLRIDTGKAKSLAIHYRATVERETVFVPLSRIETDDTPSLTAEILLYTYPSRYCQSDRLGRLAADLFGGLDSQYEQACAVCDWIHENVEYVIGSTNASTSAIDTITQREGVCRDFAHLGIALCRALNIPARYFTGYACGLEPPDFHACFEAYLGGLWLLFDATKLAPANGLVRISTGRDAADAAVATIFGNMQLTRSEVLCQLADGETLKPASKQKLASNAVTLDALRDPTGH